MITQKTVEVRLAFAFDCARCGRGNFVHSVFHEFDPTEQAEMAEEFGERPETGKWITHPENVTCEHCGETFRAVNPGEVVKEES